MCTGNLDHRFNMADRNLTLFHIVLFKEEDVWTLSEALDALMDMFADNDWYQIIEDLNLPVVIKELEKYFKSKVRSQRKELKERYPAVHTVLTNLSRFSKYIEKEANKFANSNRNAS